MAFAMAREVAALHDESSFVSSAPNRGSLPNQHYSAHPQQPLTAAPLSSTTPLTPPNSLPLGARSDRSNLPVRRLSYAEKQAKDAQGLCYNCDQKWSRSHRCASRLLLLIGDDEVEGNSAAATNQPPPELNEMALSTNVSSLFSLSGTAHPHALRLDGTWEPASHIRSPSTELHLEDKVVPQVGKNDTNMLSDQPKTFDESSPSAPAQTQRHGRPTRNIKRPNYLKDYI